LLSFNTVPGIKVTQKHFKKFFKKNLLYRGYLFKVWVLITNSLTKNLKMKKLLFVLALGAFAACGSGSTEATATDTTAVTVDTAAAPAVDTAAPAVDTAAAAVDTAAAAK
jgi:hypothetical protein